MQKCILLGGLFQLIVQLLLGIVCMTTLLVKRAQEYPQRPFGIFVLDAGKQGIGALMGHFSNIALSITINGSLVDGNSDECLWYCLSFIVDCTFGTFISLFTLYLFEQIFSTKMGEYGDTLNPSMFIWSYQLVVWLIIIIISKLFIFLFLIHMSKPLDYILGDLFSPLQQYPNFKLFLVMVIIPFILNVFQFYIQDNFLKGKANRFSHAHSQVLQLDLDEELMNSIELQDTSNSNQNSAPRFQRNRYSQVKTLLSKFKIGQKAKKESSGDLQSMDHH